MGKYHEYTPEQITWLDQNYRRHLNSEVHLKFNEKFGTNLNGNQLKHKAHRIGATATLPSCYWTVSELAAACGVSRNNILARIKRGTIEAKRFGKWLGVSPDEADRITEQYNPVFPWKVYTPTQACDKLGYGSPVALSAPINKNYIDHVRVGKLVFLRRDHILFALHWLERTGETQFYWIKLRERFENQSQGALKICQK